jgi:hypothetical protein
VVKQRLWLEQPEEDSEGSRQEDIGGSSLGGGVSSSRQVHRCSSTMVSGRRHGATRDGRVAASSSHGTSGRGGRAGMSKSEKHAPRFPCDNCGMLGHWAYDMECPNNYEI